MPTTTRTVIVCQRAGEPLDWFSASEILHQHGLPTGVPTAMFPVKRGLAGWLRLWSTRDLILPTRRFGAVTRAAGGHAARIDLPAAVTAAHTAAMHRWHHWAQVVHSTAAARPWADYLLQHTTNPARVSRDEARRRFESQPRILAMLAHVAHPATDCDLDPYEIDAYQAGCNTYTMVRWQQALTGDTVITTDGTLLQPASPSLADRLRFLAEAGAHLTRLRRDEQLIAVTLTS